MNTRHGFRLDPPSHAYLTRLDCSEEEALLDAEHEHRRCVTDADFAAWGRKWGEPLLLRARSKIPGVSRAQSNTKKLV